MEPIEGINLEKLVEECEIAFEEDKEFRQVLSVYLKYYLEIDKTENRWMRPY